MSRLTLVLASASPARLRELRHAGVRPRVLVPGIDEEAVDEPDPATRALLLAGEKGRDVLARHSESLAADGPTVLVACDSVFELDGVPYGKPLTPDRAVARLAAMRGRSGTLHTGHFVADLGSGEERSAAARSVVHFGPISDTEIASYVSTGEPLQVAGAFTIDGLGGVFIDRVDGDPHNVVGISLPLLRRMLAELGHSWTDLWG